MSSKRYDKPRQIGAPDLRSWTVGNLAVDAADPTGVSEGEESGASVRRSSYFMRISMHQKFQAGPECLLQLREETEVRGEIRVGFNSNAQPRISKQMLQLAYRHVHRASELSCYISKIEMIMDIA